tara:strand:+ start:692 stop:1495 length:804 start_codon:yes stop_codon:yes gene_type:complete
MVQIRKKMAEVGNTKEINHEAKIVSRERIYRLINQMCDAHMKVIIRMKDGGSKAVRATFDHVLGRTLFFRDISIKGLKLLRTAKVLKIEVLGMPTRVMFICKLDKQSKGVIGVQLPSSLVSIERRGTTRYPTIPQKMAYIKPYDLSVESTKMSAPPSFSSYGDMMNWLSVADMSNSGVSLITRFPGIIDNWSAGDELKAQLFLPLVAPIDVDGTVKWVKKQKIRIPSSGLERYLHQFKVGMEFSDLRDDQLIIIDQFLLNLSIGDAV